MNEQMAENSNGKYNRHNKKVVLVETQTVIMSNPINLPNRKRKICN